jgi:hypothetical protein
MTETTGHLSAAAREIQRAQTQRSILRDRLAEGRDRAADLWVRALISEIPLADRAYRLAEEECRRIEAEVALVEERLRALDAEPVGPALPGGSP